MDVCDERAATAPARRWRSVSSPRGEKEQKHEVAALIHIAVSPRVYRANKASLPAGNVVYPLKRNDLIIVCSG